MEVHGKENIPKKGGFILACNHISMLDPPLAGVAAYPRTLNYMAKNELFSNPVFAWILYHVNAFPVKRESADKSALKEAIKRLKEGKGLLVFPQGRRQIDDQAPPQAGVGFIAAKTGVPVIPAFISGTDKALPGSMRSLNKQRVSIRFGKEISFDKRMPYRDIAQRIMEEIGRLEK